MALYNEMSMDDYNKLVARNQQRQSQAAAQNLANRQAALQAAQGKKQGSLVDTLVGLATGLKDKAVDAYDTAKNVGKTAVGLAEKWTGQDGNKEIKALQKDDSARRNEIAKKYGFNSYSEAANSGNASDDFWDEIKSNNEKTKDLQKKNNEWIDNRVGNVQDINLNKAAGQALNTIDTVGMALGGGAGVAANILGGGLAGIGDQYKAAAESGEKTNDLLSTIPSKFNLKNAAAGAAGGAAGSAAGGLLGKAATKAGGNLLGKALGSQLGQGIGSGAAAGAAGGFAGTLANGGSLQDALSNAWEGAKGGAVAGGAMAGTMGLAGNALNRIRGGNVANIADNAPIRNAEPVEAQIVQKNRVEAPTAQRIEAETTPRGIAIKDLNAGAESIPVRQGATQSQGKYIDSVVRRSDANLPEAKMPTIEQRFAKEYDAPLERIIANGDMGDGVDILDVLKNSGVKQPELAAIKTGAVDAQELMGGNPFTAYNMNSRQDLPLLNRQEYYNDTIGKIGRDSNANLRAEDVPSYMQDRLRNDAGKGFASNIDNETILRQAFGDNMDKADMYRLYEELASTPKTSAYTAENFANALQIDPELSNRIQAAMLEQSNPTRKIDVQGGPTIADTIPVTDRTTRYAENTLPAKQYEQAVAKMPEAETTTPKPVVENATERATEPDYATQVERQRAQVQADKAKREAIGGVVQQYGTTRLNDRIDGLQNAIEDMLRLGLTDRAEIDLYASKMTGQNSPIAKAIRRALEDAEPIDGKWGFTWDDVFKNAGATKEAQGKITSYYEAQVKKHLHPNADGTISRNDAYDLGKALEKEGYKRYDRGVRNQNNTDYEMGEGLIYMSKAMIEKATDGVNPKGYLNLEQLKNILPGNEEHAARMTELVNNGNTVQDLRAAMSNSTKMNRFKQAEEYNINTYGQNVGGKGKGSAAVKAAKSFLTGKPLAAAEAGAEIVLGSNAAKQKAIKKSYDNYKKYQAQANGEAPTNPTGKVAKAKQFIADKTGRVGETAKNIAGKAGEKISKATAGLNDTTLSGKAMPSKLGDYTLGQFASDMANRTIAKDQAEFANNRANAAQAQAAYDQAATDYTTALANQQAAEQNVLQGQTGNTATLNRIAQAMDLAMAAGDINAYSQLADLYKQAYNIYEMQNPTAKNEGKALSANQSKALAASQQLEQLAQMTPNAGTVASNIPLLGNLVDLTGGNEYANQAEALATTLGYLLSGANIKESEAKRIGQSYVPTAFDSENVRQQKLDRARQLIQSYMSDTGALAA